MCKAKKFTLNTKRYICIFTIASWYWNDKIDHCVAKPSASMILTMGDKLVLVFNEKSINNKDGRSHSNRIRSNGIGLCVLTCNILISIHRSSLPIQGVSTHDIDYNEYHGCWWPGNVNKVSTCIIQFWIRMVHCCIWDRCIVGFLRLVSFEWIGSWVGM